MPITDGCPGMSLPLSTSCSLKSASFGMYIRWLRMFLASASRGFALVRSSGTFGIALSHLGHFASEISAIQRGCCFGFLHIVDESPCLNTLDLPSREILNARVY